MSLSYAQVESLFREYRAELLRRMSQMVRSRDTAADLVQETYLRLVRLTDIQSVGHPRALLHRIATNLAIDHLRAGQSGLGQAEPLDAALELPSPRPTQERELMGKQRLEQYMTVINNLPPRTREAFLLYRVHGCAYLEIAARMNISVSGVDKHIRRAIDQTTRAIAALDQNE